MHIIESHTVSLLVERVRISDYGGSHLIVCPTRSSFKKAIKADRVLLNGRIAQTSDWITSGDRIEILGHQENIMTHRVPIAIEYEDEHMAIVNKPAGLNTSGNMHASLYNALPYNCSLSTEADALHRPMPIHRLDKLASGLLVVAKTKRAQLSLQKQLEQNGIEKTYRIITYGRLALAGKVCLPLDGKAAQTSWITIEHIASNKYGDFSVADVEIIQGRTHQIRRHMHSIKHGLIGDRLYSNRLIHAGKGLYLCCHKIQLSHPISNELIRIQMALPHKFEEFPK